MLLMMARWQTSEAVMQRKEKGEKEAKVDTASEEVVYKIDISANRRDSTLFQP